MNEPDTSPFFKAYVRFLARIASAQEGLAADKELGLDANEKALLELVLLRWAQQMPLTVRQTIAFGHLGSPATLHKRLIRLRHKSYLQLQDVSGDKRAKHLVPGPAGMAHMELMGKYLLGARRASGAAVV